VSRVRPVKRIETHWRHLSYSTRKLLTYGLYAGSICPPRVADMPVFPTGTLLIA